MHLDEDEIAEYYDDLRASGGNGTIRRPLHGKARRDPTVRWGDTLALEFKIATDRVVTGQFLRVSLPSPRVCSLAFHADVIAEPSEIGGVPTEPIVYFTALDVFIATGSSEYLRRIAFSNAPMVGAPVDYVLAHVPLQNVYVKASAQAIVGTGAPGVPDRCVIRIAGQLAPVQSVAGQQ